MSTISQRRPAPIGEGRVTTTPNKALLTTSNPFEQSFGYHRAVRRGPLICVSGTTAVELLHSTAESTGPSRVRHPGDAHRQALFAVQRCVHAVNDLGGKREDIIRVRMFVANHEDCGAVGQAFKEFFTLASDAIPLAAGCVQDVVGAAATIIVVPGGFIDKDMLVEVEVDAWCI